VEPPRPLTGVLLAFASGALISALSFELFEEAFMLGGAARSGLGLLGGAVTFVAVDSWLDRRMTSSPARASATWRLAGWGSRCWPR